jgi:hypothetical protein
MGKTLRRHIHITGILGNPVTIAQLREAGVIPRVAYPSRHREVNFEHSRAKTGKMTG